MKILVVTLVLFDYPADVCFDCSKCGLCCGDTPEKKRRVLMLKSDAQKIVEHTQQPISHFARKVRDSVPYVFEMRKNPVDGKCVFLKNSQCTIYSQRPLICRFYPVELTTDETGKHIFKVTLECPGVCCLDTVGVGKRLGKDYFRALLELAHAELSDASN